MAETTSAPSFFALAEVDTSMSCDVGLVTDGADNPLSDRGYLNIGECEITLEGEDAARIGEALAELWNGYGAKHLINPTTLTEAVAAARDKGVREGLERAAALHETVEIARLCALLTEAVGALQPFAGAAAEEHMRFVKNEQRLFLETMAEVCITRDIRGGDLRRAQSALENLTSGLALTAQEQMEKLAKELGTSGTAETFRAALAVAKQAASEARATLTPGGRTDG